jgi:hypothetical protein
MCLETCASGLTFGRVGFQYDDLKEKNMDSVFIITFLILAPAILRRQMRGVRWDWKVWGSLISVTLFGVAIVFPGLCGKPLPHTLILPVPVASAAMVVLFMVFLVPDVRRLLDELQRAHKEKGADTKKKGP